MEGLLAHFSDGKLSINKKYIDYTTNDGVPPRIVLSEADLRGISRLVIPGGTDIDPTIFGMDNESSISVNRALDKFQMGIIAKAVSLKIPIFGICRGFQLLYLMYKLGKDNTRWEQSLPGHNQNINSLERGDFFHQVYFQHDDNLTGMFTNSMHHQGVAFFGKTAPDWITYLTYDGKYSVVEGMAFEVDGCPIAGVQWHPEEL